MVRKRVHQTTSLEDTAPSPPSAMSSNPGVGVAGAASSSRRTQWIFYAVASGACAAFNGVFAKLTTTKLTTTLAESIASLFGISDFQSVVEIVVRVMFFALNLTFNAIMWTLFTTALAKGTSTTQVSIMNTSTNFCITAVLGFLIFSEALPPMWWVGAAFLVAGSVIVGRKDEGDDAGGEYVPLPREDEGEAVGERDEDVIDLGDIPEGRRR